MGRYSQFLRFPGMTANAKRDGPCTLTTLNTGSGETDVQFDATRAPEGDNENILYRWKYSSALRKYEVHHIVAWGYRRTRRGPL